jgi:glycosyltransferase involved in cell wall biosynthesis
MHYDSYPWNCGPYASRLLLGRSRKRVEHASRLDGRKAFPRMKIALIGTRGVPANYGGFETCAEELAVGLAARGHDITVYCRPGNVAGDPSSFRGAKLVYRKFVDTKSLGTISHTANCLFDAVRRDFDVLMVFNAGNGPLCVVPRLWRKPFAVNVDGLEWKRAKWGRLVKLYYQFGEWASAHLADRVVSDSRAIQKYYDDRFSTPSTFIAYGAHVETSERPGVLDEYDLSPGDYFFVASRLEPENNADLTVRAFEKTKTEKKLVIAGGANWDSPFVEQLKRTTDPRVQLLGPIYKDGHIPELHAHCYAYVHGNEVGGTNPALLKAMGYGNCILALDVPFNAEVVGESAMLYSKDADDLASKMQVLLDNPALAAEYRRRAPERIEEAYQWDTVVRDYEILFERLKAGYYVTEKASD